MLPPTSALRPPAEMISPASVVVVVLPLEPVMATMWPFRNRAASSTSPITGMPALARVYQLRNVEGHARTDDDQVLIAKCAFAVLSGFHADAVIEQQRDFLAKLLLRSGVGDGDLGAALGQKQSAGRAGLAQSHHQHAFALTSICCSQTTESCSSVVLPWCSHPPLCHVPGVATSTSMW